jgi:excisionase family DNA binding protein
VKKADNNSEIAKPVLNVKEAAKFLGVSHTLVWSEIRKGNLTPFRLGDRVLFNRSYLESLGATR